MKNLQKGFALPILLTIIALLAIGGGMYIYENKKIDTSISNVVNKEMSSSKQTQGTNTQGTSVKRQQNTKSVSTNNEDNRKKTFVECMGVGQQICYESEPLRTVIIRKQALEILNSGDIKKSADINVEIFKSGVNSPFTTITDRTLVETRGHGIVFEFESNQGAKKYFDSSFSLPASNRTIVKISENMMKETRSGVLEANLIFYVNKFIISFEGVSP